MKKTFALQDLDCANCAAKIENALNNLEGMTKATVSFMSQRMTVEAPDDKFDDLMKQVKKTVRKLEPDVIIKA